MKNISLKSSTDSFGYWKNNFPLLYASNLLYTQRISRSDNESVIFISLRNYSQDKNFKFFEFVFLCVTIYRGKKQDQNCFISFYHTIFYKTFYSLSTSTDNITSVSRQNKNFYRRRRRRNHRRQPSRASSLSSMTETSMALEVSCFPLRYICSAHIDIAF